VLDGATHLCKMDKSPLPSFNCFQIKVVLHRYAGWSDGAIKVTSLDTKSMTVTLAEKPPHGFRLLGNCIDSRMICWWRYYHDFMFLAISRTTSKTFDPEINVFVNMSHHANIVYELYHSKIFDILIYLITE
jgi:hypothetical protein